MTVVINGTTGITNDGGYTGDGVVFADTTPANTLVTTTGGNVGIGTSSPGALLDVSAAGTAIAKLTNRNSGATEVVLSLDAGGNGVNVRDSQIRGGNNGSNQTYLSFLTSAAATPVERGRFDASANFLVGTPSAHGYSPSNAISAIASNGATISLQPTTAASFSTRIWFPNSTNVYFDNSSTASYIFSQGNGSSFATVSAIINNTSDYRLKENITPMTGAISKIQKLKPIQFSYVSSMVPAMPCGTDLTDGFLAHEYGEVIPGGTTGAKDAVNEDGSIKPQGIDLTRAIPLMVAAIQEIKAINDAQAETITALTARVAALEGTQP